MALKETLTPLKATNNATYKTVNGVTYFKLKSEFEGDYTKHCGLLGEEIDENFYFLRGYDIESITVDENRNLIINRVEKDYAPLVVNIGEELGQPSFKFNKDNGTITVTFPDGTTSVMEGFLVEGKDIRIATDSTLNGNGTIYNPLRISPVDETGTFAPADEYFDITNGEAMPEGKGKGYRVVTKEKIDNFGCLYPFSAVKKIQDKLTETGSQWRVPTKEDWDELLNAFECEEDRNHNSNKSTWLGKAAGRALKSYNLWNEHKTSPTETPTYGEDVVGLSIYPLGIGPDRNELINDDNSDVEGFGKIAGMWTNSYGDDGNAYVKLFGFNSGKVDQDTYGEGSRMSIRLVKEYAYSNFNEIENILGFPYPTELVYGPHEDCPYVKIWTKINLYSDAETLDGIRSDEWSVVSDSDKGVKIVYFINEWDGTEWHKKPMGNGDSVVILERIISPSAEYYMKKYNIKTDTYEYIQLTTEQGEDASKNGFTFVKMDVLPKISKNTPDYVVIETEGEIAKYHEWRIIDGELIDTAEALAEEFEDELAKETEERIDSDKKLLEAIQKESEIRESVDKQLREAIVAEAEQRKKSDDELLSAIQKESEVRETIDNQLHEAIKNEASIRKSVDDQLLTAIRNEATQRKESDDNLLKAIQKESEVREAADKQLHEAIVSEAEQRKKSDDELLSAIQKESEVRESVDNQLHEAIKNEASIRKSVDDQLLTAIRNEGVIRKNNDIVPGTYILDGDSSKEMVIPTYSEDVADVKIKVSDDFFNFGEF